MRLLPALAATAALLATTPAAATAARAPSGLVLDGAVTRTSVVVTRCPINGGMARSTETTTTSYSHAFSGRSGRRGEITTKGHHQYEMDRRVEGVSDAVRDAHAGPIVRPLGESATTFNPAITARIEGRGRRARRVLDVDFAPFAGGLRYRRTVPMPTRSRRTELPIQEAPTSRELPSSGGCTATETITVTGWLTMTRR